MPQDTERDWKERFYKMFATRTDSLDLYVDTERFISDLLASERQKWADEHKNWYMDGDELVITKGKWTIGRFSLDFLSPTNTEGKE